jgi:hypothetical protein
VRYVDTSSSDCRIELTSLQGSKTMLHVQEILDEAQVNPSAAVRLTTMSTTAPLRQSVPVSQHLWSLSPLTLWQGKKQWLNIKAGNVALVHPRLTPQRPADHAGFTTLLEPHWAPVYVTQELGG